MKKTSFSIFHLTEEQAITLLSTPTEQLEDPTDRYIAASRLVEYPSERAVEALIQAIHQPGDDLDNRIVRRKSVETLGHLRAAQALPTIRVCLEDDDCYTVENAVWAIGEIAGEEHAPDHVSLDETILEEITNVLKRPGQNYRVIIQTLGKLGYKAAADRIRPWMQAEDLMVASAAIATLYRLGTDIAAMPRIVEMLQDANVNVRRSCLQDLINTNYYSAIAQIAQCPVSMVFRLRAIQCLAVVGMQERAITFAEDVEPYLDQVIYDHPDTVELVHEYDQTPTIEFAVNELYETDFGRCYLATKTLLEVYPQEAPAALLAAYEDKAHHDYGGYYHVMRLFGWLNYDPAYDLLVKALHNQESQFKKARVAGAIALGRLGKSDAIAELQSAWNTGTWELQYAILIALDQLGGLTQSSLQSEHPLVQAKLSSLKG
ncbi:HEAT repeat domain-containing protein [Leptothoe spongobia]|uniref:HEAT repeat domain-containing protein n=1 Tax=Leptothoe spongobia TAU-MAC 1115 TaxID=1967444 RepID=A0A947GML8_9CYAN|nr:HEAT repeat domain-containing protein [Leptothoe spongobia]MBT9315611.1 HEAT repeat domain-containing protein [Leptothoe spongobia TAU-MAC 1115]